MSTRFHRPPGKADIIDHTLFAQLGEDSFSLVGDSHFGVSAILPLSMSIGPVSQPAGEDDSSLVGKKLAVSSACLPLSMSMETISMALMLSSCVAVKELMIAPFFASHKQILRTFNNSRSCFFSF